MDHHGFLDWYGDSDFQRYGDECFQRNGDPYRDTDVFEYPDRDGKHDGDIFLDFYMDLDVFPHRNEDGDFFIHADADFQRYADGCFQRDGDPYRDTDAFEHLDRDGKYDGNGIAHSDIVLYFNRNLFRDSDGDVDARCDFDFQRYGDAFLHGDFDVHPNGNPFHDPDGFNNRDRFGDLDPCCHGHGYASRDPDFDGDSHGIGASCLPFGLVLALSQSRVGGARNGSSGGTIYLRPTSALDGFHIRLP